MLTFQLQVLLVALFAAIPLAVADGALHRDILDNLLDTGDAGDGQDFSRKLLLKVIADLMMKTEDEAVPEMKDLEAPPKVVRQLPLSQRERKAGCRNFFWKTYTSC